MVSPMHQWPDYCRASSIIFLHWMLDSLIGGVILSLLVDSIGGKKLLTLSCLIMSTASIFAAFSKNIWIYSALRILSGFGRAAIGSCVLVLSTECVGRQWRGSMGIIGLFCSTLGFLSLPAIAYLIRSYSWRTLYLFTALLAIVYCICIQFCVFESPRWLLQQGQVGESLAVLNTYLSPESSNSKLGLPNLLPYQNKKVKVDRNQSFIRVLLKNRSIPQRLLPAMVVGFGIGIIYYGMPLSLGNLEFNLCISVAYNALLEIPLSLMTLYLAKCKRKGSLLALCITSGACGVLCILAGKWRVLQVGLELISFFTACIAYNLLLIYIVELSCSRRAQGTRHFQWCGKPWCSVVSSLLSPLVIVVGGHYSKMLPDFVFGVVILVLGSLVMFLPEAMDEQEQNNEAPYGV